MDVTELETLRRKCLFVNRYMAEHGGFPPALLSHFVKFRKRINEAYLIGNLKMLRAISADIDFQVVNNMPFSMVLKINNLLKNEINTDFDAFQILQQNTINNILKSERIENCEEYNLVKYYLQNNCTAHSSVAIVEKLNVLLADFLKP